MTYLMQRIDSDLAWFVISVLVVLLLSSLIWGFGLKRKQWEHELLIYRAKQAQPTLETFVYPANLETPTFLRKTPHYSDGKKYNLAVGVREPEPKPITIDDIRKLN
jgi:hypothetical protein